MTLREYLESWDKEYLNEGIVDKTKSGLKKIGDFINKKAGAIVSKICIILVASCISVFSYAAGQQNQFKHDILTSPAYEVFENNIQDAYKSIQRDLILRLNPKYQKIGDFDLSKDKNYFEIVEELNERLLKLMKEKSKGYAEAAQDMAGPVGSGTGKTSMKKAEKVLGLSSELATKHMKEEYKKFLKEKNLGEFKDSELFK